MGKGIEGAGSPSTRRVEQPKEQEVQKPDQAPKEQQSPKEQSRVDQDPNVRNARGESNFESAPATRNGSRMPDLMPKSDPAAFPQGEATDDATGDAGATKTGPTPADPTTSAAQKVTENITKAFSSATKILDASLQGPIKSALESGAITAEDAEAAKTFLKGMGGAMSVMKGGASFASAIDAMNRGDYKTGISKLVDSVSSFAGPLANLVKDASQMPWFKPVMTSISKYAGPAGAILGGALRMALGSGGKPPDATDYTVGAGKIAAGVLQAFPATVIPGTLASLGIDIADQTGFARSAVEKTGEAWGSLQRGIAAQQQELEAARTSGAFVMPVGGGA